MGTTPVAFADENYVKYGVRHINNKPRVSSMPYLYDIAEGNIPDHSAVRRFGHNHNVGTSWETVYATSNLKTYLTSAERLQIVSDDVADDSTGTGARTLTVVGLDTNYDALTETITMNGTTNVLTDASFLRVECITVATAGSLGYNKGTITISNNADDTVLEQIAETTNQSLCACYTVPNGKTCYVTQSMATESSSKGSNFSFWVRPFGGLWAIQREITLLDSSLVLPMTIPMKIPAKADIEIRAKGILAGANVTAGFEGWVEDD